MLLAAPWNIVKKMLSGSLAQGVHLLPIVRLIDLASLLGATAELNGCLAVELCLVGVLRQLPHHHHAPVPPEAGPLGAGGVRVGGDDGWHAGPEWMRLWQGGTERIDY